MFAPGTYTSATQLTLATHNYFRSGVYYLKNLGEWDIGKWVTAGRPVNVNDDKRLSTYDVETSPCKATKDADTGNGALFVLGGNSSIVVKNIGGTAGRFEV